MSLSSVLPAPKNAHLYIEENKKSLKTKSPETSLSKKDPGPPPYGKRDGFIPKLQSDYDDGGAFPEIPIVQFPLAMGRTSEDIVTKTTPVSVDSKGEIKYDAVIKQNIRKDKHIFTSHSDLTEKNPGALSKPSQKVADAVAENTRTALEKVIESKIKSARPRHVAEDNAKTDNSNNATYIRYTPSQQGKEFNSGAKTRIIRMQNMPIDPMEPPKHKFRKVAERPPSPPVPILHSPPRKVTVKDQEDWKVPPCVSNWKNIKGYTIPLDKRLAADGRGLESVTINSRFSALSSALYEAENVARENVRMRGEQMRRIQQQQRVQKESELEERARKALEGRKTGFYGGDRAVGGDVGIERQGSEQSPGTETQDKTKSHLETKSQVETKSQDETKSQIESRIAREELRRERMRERKREYRVEERDKRIGRRSRYERDRDRDISEKIALGQGANATGASSEQSRYDQRLFNQTAGGVGSGFRAEDSYDVYDKPLFNSTSQSIYKPKVLSDDDETGAAETGPPSEKKRRRGEIRNREPVEFVKDDKKSQFEVKKDDHRRHSSNKDDHHRRHSSNKDDHHSRHSSDRNHPRQQDNRRKKSRFDR